MKHPGAQLRAVLFDLDGTLVDTANDFVPAVQQLREEHDLGPMDAARIRASVSNGARALVRLALNMDERDPAFEGRRQRFLALYAQNLGEHAAPYPGILELLHYLDGAGIAWGIATNKPRQYTLPLLKTLALTPASVICPEDVSAPKPHPVSLEKGCKELDCHSGEVVYLGDHVRDIEAGKRAGIYTIAAAYGYIEPGDSAELWGADAIAAQSSEIHALLFPSKERQYA